MHVLGPFDAGFYSHVEYKQDNLQPFGAGEHIWSVCVWVRQTLFKRMTLGEA